MVHACVQTVTVEHPVNKSDLFTCNGLTVTIDILKIHPLNEDINRQGIALILNLISPDRYVRYSAAQARHLAMSNGIVDVLHRVQKEFRSKNDILVTSKGILDLIIADYS